MGVETSSIQGSLQTPEGSTSDCESGPLSRFKSPSACSLPGYTVHQSVLLSEAQGRKLHQVVPSHLECWQAERQTHSCTTTFYFPFSEGKVFKESRDPFGSNNLLVSPTFRGRSPLTIHPVQSLFRPRSPLSRVEPSLPGSGTDVHRNRGGTLGYQET